MNKISAEFDAFEKFENSKGLLKFALEYRDIPMWPLIRNQIIVHGIFHKFDINSNHVHVKSDNNMRNCYMEKITYRNPYFSMHKDLVYIGFPNSNFLKHGDGMVYDERIKAYVDLYRRSSMIISITENDEFRYGYRNWKSDYIVNKFATDEKHKNKSKKDSSALRQLVKFLEDKCPVEIDNELKNIISGIVMFYSQYLNRYVKAWKTYLKVVRPKLVIEYCGCFMGISNVAMNLACDDLGIPTAEIQVCATRRNMHSYYCGLSITENEICKKIYPDYFLAWGEYWKKFVHNPCRTVTIGTHRRYQCKSERNNNVLICLSINCQSYLKYIDFIMNHTNIDTQIYLRIHPKENTASTRNLFKSYEKDSRFHFANERELQDYLNECTYVFSSAGTVVYEALACGKIVFVSKDNMYDWLGLESIDNKIHSFDTLEQFSGLWEKRESMQMEVCKDFFDMNYKKLFRQFVKDVTKKA